MQARDPNNPIRPQQNYEQKPKAVQVKENTGCELKIENQKPIEKEKTLKRICKRKKSTETKDTDNE